MSDRYDLNKLLRFAKEYGVSFTASYWEGSDELEIETHSAAPTEEYHIKRVPSVDFFIEQWKEKCFHKTAKEE